MISSPVAHRSLLVTEQGIDLAMDWKIDVLRVYIWHQRLHLLQDCRGRARTRRRKKDIFGVLYSGQLQSFTVTHHISWAIQRAVLAVLAATSNSGSLPQQGTYRQQRLSPLVVIILAYVNFFSIVFVCELQTTVVSL